MSIEDNKALVQRFFEVVINQRNLAALDQFLSPNTVNHTGPSPEAEPISQSAPQCLP